MTSIGGVILAGGESSRMGTPKALLDWHGAPLVVHVARSVARATGGRVVVVAAPGQELPADLDIVRDPIPGRGPLQGLAAGLAALSDCERAFVCATDQPHAHQILPELLSAPHADVVAYAGQPLGALYATSLATLAAERLQTGGDDHSLRGLLAAVDTHTMPGEPPAALRSLDTPQDYADALSRS